MTHRLIEFCNLTVMQIRKLLSATAFVGLLAAGVGTASTPSVVQAAGECLCSGGEFHALPPTRIFDSRPSSAINDPAPGPKSSGAQPGTPTFNVRLLGQGGIPSAASEVLGVVVSVTVVGATQPGNLRAFPKGPTPSLTSVLTFKGAAAVSNLSILSPGIDGDATFALASGFAGKANVLVDVFGWFSTSTADRGARLIATTPSRVMDTRTGVGVPVGSVPSNSFVTLNIRGADGVDPSVTDVVPNSGDVVGVMLNVAVVNNLAGQRGTYVSVVPESPNGSPPGTSNVNVGPGLTKSNSVIVPVGADGKVRLFNSNGNVHIAVDVLGYLVNNEPIDSRAGRVVPLSSPFRAFDTRQLQFGAVRLGPGQSEEWSFAAFAASVNIAGAGVGNQSAVIGNMVTVDLARLYPTVPVAGYITVYPGGTTLPKASAVNNVEGSAVSNLVVAKYGANSTVRVYNAQGSVHYLFDALAVLLSD